MCRKGDVMYVKPDEHNPRPYCVEDFPVYNYPGMCTYTDASFVIAFNFNCITGMSHAESGTGNLKLWWRLKAVIIPERKSRCTVYCRTGNYVP